MKCNKLIFTLMIIFIVVVFVGCSSGTDTSQKVAQVNNATADGQKVVLPEEQPVLIGKVSEIVGNEVTVFKSEVSQDEETPQEEPVSEEVQDKINAIHEKVQNGTITPEQAREELQNLGFQPNPNHKRANGMQFTEETETFIIPVGTPIVTMQRGTNEANQVELSKIKKDVILRIWKQDDIVSFVQIAGGNNSMGARQGTSGQGPGAGGGMPPDMGGGPPPGMGGN